MTSSEKEMIMDFFSKALDNYQDRGVRLGKENADENGLSDRFWDGYRHGATDYFVCVRDYIKIHF